MAGEWLTDAVIKYARWISGDISWRSINFSIERGLGIHIQILKIIWLEQICALILTLNFPNVQFQKGGSDCGLFSIAFAASLCTGFRFYPADLQYNQTLHLLNCIDLTQYIYLKKRQKSDYQHFTVSADSQKEEIWYNVIILSVMNGFTMNVSNYQKHQ